MSDQTAAASVRRPRPADAVPPAGRGSVGFTLVELLVVIGIVALLISILMPALNNARQQANAIKCMSNLRQITLAWHMYSNEHKGKTMPTHTTQHFGAGTGDIWVAFLRPYYGATADIRNCPTAPEPLAASANSLGIPQGTTHYAWGPSYDGPGTTYTTDRPDDYGGYGLNGWSEDPGQWINGTVLLRDNFLRHLGAKVDAGNFPVFGDCVWSEAGWPLETNPPPANYNRPIVGVDSQLARFAMYRHKKAINMAFVDGSARTVPVPELWRLQWHRNWNLRLIAVR
jgi:prepilin-type N-terminal cleavage/methylation domain-containing protein/prepilin-type processing-associated H-X9-DG protein